MAATPVKRALPPDSVVCSFCDQPPYQATLTKCNHLFCQKQECLPRALATRSACPLCREETSLQECGTIDLYLRRIAYYLSHQPELMTSRQDNLAKDECSICSEDNDPPVHFITQNPAKERIGELFCHRCFTVSARIQVPGRVYRSLTPFQVFALGKDLPPIPTLSFSGLAALAHASIKHLITTTPEVCLFCDKLPYEATLTKCDHLFCQKITCLPEYFKRNSECPVCRTVTNLQECGTIDVPLKIIAQALSQSAETVNSKIRKLASGRCTICLYDDDPSIRYISNNSAQGKVGKFLCQSCFVVMGPLSITGRDYQALTPFQVVALAKELPALTPPSRYISISVATLMVLSFCHRVINENAFGNQNTLLTITASPADMSIKIVNFFLMLMKKQSSSS